MMAEVRAHYIHGKTSSNSHCANFLLYEKKAKMEFLDNTLTKDSSVFLHAICGFYRKLTHSGFKNTKKSAKQEN
jgi:hypothetical protein